MDIEAECFSTHLIDGDGTFNSVGLDNFVKQIKLGKCGFSYAVVAIMGPQSSGKSTLLNHLFYTNFKEMNAYMGRSQTTKGIWIARCPDIEPCTIVMDLEGTNGRERGEDDTAFEKQSALFALSISDIVLINMWCHDIGLVHAAYKPLLKTVFQVMTQVFSPRKTTLMFVIRDKTITPIEHLESVLRDDIQKIWDSIPKPEAHKHTRLSKFFDVHIVALSSCEKEEQFKEQVASLRQKFFQSIAPGGLAGDRQGVVPASGFSFSAEQIWKVIKENKDLDLQSHKVMVATKRCEEIAKEEYSFFLANEGWLELEEAVQSHLVPGFGKKLSSLLYNCLSSYDGETIYFEDNIRSAKRKQLEEQLKQLVQPAYHLMLERIQVGAIDNFKKALRHALAEGQGFAVAARDCTNKFLKIFDGQLEGAVIYQANWDLDKVRDKYAREIISYISEAQFAILSELTTVYKSKLKEALYDPLEALLRGGRDDTWPAIRKLLHDETETALSEFSFALSGFEMSDKSNEDMISLLKNYSRGIIVQKTREEAKRVSYHMKERFTSIFNYDNGSMPRVWTGKEEIRAISISARLSSIKLLSVFAAIRLDGDTHTIEDTLAIRLFGPYKGTLKTSRDPLASKTWKEVGATNTVISPVDCNLLWNQFLRETDDIITQALASQETKKRKISSCYIIPQISTTAGAATSSSSCAMSPIMDTIRATKVPTKKRSNKSRSESIASLMTPNSICSFFQFPNNIKGERRWKYQEKLAALRSRVIEPARTIDWEILEQFNLADEIRGFLGIEYTNGDVDIKSSEWVNLFSIVEPIYRELCLEFFSTYQFNEKSHDYTDDKALTFRLGGLDRHCSVKEFGARMGLYPQALADNPNFLHFLKSGAVAPAMDFDYEGFWSKIGKGSYNINLPLKESDIRHPVHRILHRMLSYSITARKKTNGVTKMDLWYLSSFLNKDKHLNAAHCLASYLTEPVGRFKTRVIYGGHFVTRLAKSYLFFTDAFRLRLTQVQHMTLIDHASLIRMNILPKDVRSGVLTLCDQLDLEHLEDEGLDEEAPQAHERDPTMPDIEVRVAHMENDITIMKGTLDLDSEDERMEVNEDEEPPPTHERRNPTMPDIGVRVANMERDIANINGTVFWLQRSMIRVLNHLQVPPEPPDNEAGPSTIQRISLSDVD